MNITQGRWITEATTIDEAVERYHGKRFKVRFSTDHHVIVQVEKVELYGGVVRTFCTVLKTVKRWKTAKHDKSRYQKGGEYIFSGRLEPLEEGDSRHGSETAETMDHHSRATERRVRGHR